MVNCLVTNIISPMSNNTSSSTRPPKPVHLGFWKNYDHNMYISLSNLE
jgi:hypothetical protein